MSVDEGNVIFSSPANCNAIIQWGDALISGCKNTVIPEGIRYINYGAFQRISTLTSINIPASVRNINEGSAEGNPFMGCTGLTSITVAAGNPYFDSRDGCNAIIETATNTLRVGCKATTFPETVTSIGSAAFEESALTSITIPSKVTSIQSQAFMDSKSLTEATLPASLTAIGMYAFDGCTALTKVTSHVQQPFSIADRTFGYWNYSLQADQYPATLYVPYGTKAKYESASGWKGNFKDIVEMSIGTGIYAGMPGLDAGAVYTLDGRKLQGQPAQKGVYIINSRKVVLK